MKKSDHYHEHRSLSVAWASSIRTLLSSSGKEIAPLIVSFTGFDDTGTFEEESRIKGALEAILKKEGMQSIHTVANTIFPVSMWNPAAGRQQLFDRYASIVSKLQMSRENKRGLYFDRMISGGAKDRENQLDFVIETFLGRQGTRRSALQVAIFNPSVDHSTAALLGFPCLQHVTFAPTKAGLTVNAFYAVQYMVERAYGNYVGLARLGQFVAHELKMKLARVTCYAGIAQCDTSKEALKPISKALDTFVKEHGDPWS